MKNWKQLLSSELSLSQLDEIPVGFMQAPGWSACEACITQLAHEKTEQENEGKGFSVLGKTNSKPHNLKRFLKFSLLFNTDMAAD